MKIPATDASEKSGDFNLKTQATSPEDIIYIDTGHESPNQ